MSKKNPAEIIETTQPEDIEDLEALKGSEEPHAEFYESLRLHRAKVVSDLEALQSAKEKENTAE